MNQYSKISAFFSQRSWPKVQIAFPATVPRVHRYIYSIKVQVLLTASARGTFPLQLTNIVLSQCLFPAEHEKLFHTLKKIHQKKCELARCKQVQRTANEDQNSNDRPISYIAGIEEDQCGFYNLFYTQVHQLVSYELVSLRVFGSNPVC